MACDRYVDPPGLLGIRRSKRERPFFNLETCVSDINRSQLLKYRTEILELLTLLADKTKSERGYAGTGRLIHRILHTLSAIYPINARLANADEWDDPGKSCCSIYDHC